MRVIPTAEPQPALITTSVLGDGGAVEIGSTVGDDDSASTTERLTAHDASTGVAVGQLRVSDSAGDGSTEAVVWIDPVWRDRGIATLLLDAAAPRARARGIRNITVTLAVHDTALRAALIASGFHAVELDTDDEHVALRIDLDPDLTFLQHHDARLHAATVASLRPMLHPRSVAVVGASRTPGKVGATVLEHILAANFRGSVHAVHPTADTIQGVPCVARVSDIPFPVDLVVVCVPVADVLDVARDALGAGARSLCVITAGFAEAADGVDRQQQLRLLVLEHGARLLGPNCLGLAVAASHLDATFARLPMPGGSIACASQSGAIGLSLLERADERGFGFHTFASLGNKADISANDLLAAWDDDPSVRAIALYLESFGNPRRFARLARRVGQHTPIIVLHGGASQLGARAAQSHTAALASSPRVTAALFDEAGVVVARDLEQLVDLVAYFDTQPQWTGGSIAVVTNAGGLGILAADAASACGLQLARLGSDTRAALATALAPAASVANPIDVLGSATAPQLEAAIEIVLGDPDVDALVIAVTPPANLPIDQASSAIQRAVDHATANNPALADKPIAISLVADHAPSRIDTATRTLPVYPYPERAVNCIGAAARRSARTRRDDDRLVPTGAPVDVVALRALADDVIARGEGGWMTPAEGMHLLEFAGLPSPAAVCVSTADAAGEAFRSIGGPVAIKAASGTTAEHKSDRGGVHLDVDTDERARAVAAQLGGHVLVQRMAAAGTELMCGMVQDPRFGPIITLGPGGTWAELVEHPLFRMAPLTSASADELIDAPTVRTLVAGFRGRSATDRTALRDVLARISMICELVPELIELDINPLITSGHSCQVVDIRARFAPIGSRTQW